MASIAHLRQLADDPRYAKHPPEDFAFLMGMRKCSHEFLLTAWGYFKQVRKPISVLDVREWLYKNRDRTMKRPDGSDDMEVGCVDSHFLDSGAFTLWTTAEKWAKEHKKTPRDFYDTQEHWDYLDEYAKFVTDPEIAIGIDYYANVDAIGFADLTYRNQKYLEKKHGLSPVPVVHFPGLNIVGKDKSLDWLQRYMGEGYEFIGLGGLVGSTSQDECRGWIDRCFNIVCDQPNRMPKVRIHGFGLTSYELMTRYPWWSIDSTSWTKMGAFGGVMIPKWDGSKFSFEVSPQLCKMSLESPSRKDKAHYLNKSQAEKEIIHRWLKEIGVPLGKVNEDGETVEFGVLTRHTERRTANLLLFERVRNWLPKYPWPWRSERGRKKTLGVV